MLSVNPSSHRRLFAALAFVGFVVRAGALYAQADPQRTAAAKALYDRAVEEMEQGEHIAACPKLEEAIQLEPAAIGARMTLAQCYEGAGRLASAWTTYLTVEQMAGSAGQKERQARAHEQAEALKPKLAHVIIEVPDELKDIPDLDIRRDGIPVGRGQWDTPIPIDRGNHRIEIKGDGKRVQRLFVITKDGQPVRVKLPRLRESDTPVTPYTWPTAPSARPAAAQSKPAVDPLYPTIFIYPTSVSDSIDGVGLYETDAFGHGAVTHLVCRAPCGKSIYVGPGKQFFLGGDKLSNSSEFRIPPTETDVTISTSPGRNSVRQTGVLMVVVGIAGAIAGGVILGDTLTDPISSDTAATKASVGILVGGSVVLAAGIGFVGLGRTTYSISVPED